MTLRSRSTRLMMSALLATSALSAQQARPLEARNFFFDDYMTVIRWDLRELRASGMWQAMLPEFASNYATWKEHWGFPPEHIDQITITSGLLFPDTKNEKLADITTYAGNAELGLWKDLRETFLGQEQVGTNTLYRLGEARPTTLRKPYARAATMPDPKLVVVGPFGMVQSVLKGQPRGGRPSGDIMSLTDNNNGCMLELITDLSLDRAWLAALRRVLSPVEWPKGDEPLVVALRFRAVENDGDFRFRGEMTIRHGTAGEGLAATEAAISKAVEEVLANDKYKDAWHEPLRTLQHRRDRTDAVYSIDLGSPETVHGNLIYFALVYFNFVAIDEPAADR